MDTVAKLLSQMPAPHSRMSGSSASSTQSLIPAGIHPGRQQVETQESLPPKCKTWLELLTLNTCWMQLWLAGVLLSPSLSLFHLLSPPLSFCFSIPLFLPPFVYLSASQTRIILKHSKTRELFFIIDISMRFGGALTYKLNIIEAYLASWVIKLYTSLEIPEFHAQESIRMRHRA